MSLFAHADGSVTNYSYNADGIRTGKQYLDAGGGELGTVKYTLDGNKIVAEQRGNTMLYYLYDDNGAVMGIGYGDNTYTFAKNLQGDVIGIYNSSRQLVAKYTYNAFGQITAITGSNGNDVSGNATHIANINPFRYRGYYYDTETGLYYLKSRYYDPIVGRFINADAFVSTGQGILGNNMFAYCNNNPVNLYDFCGSDPVPLWAIRINNGSATAEDYEAKGSMGLGSIFIDGTTGGWEGDIGSSKIFNFGHAEAGFEYENGKFYMGAMASIWSPDASINIGDYSLGIGAEVGAIGFGYYKNSTGFRFEIGLGIGFSINIDW